MTLTRKKIHRTMSCLRSRKRDDLACDRDGRRFRRVGHQSNSIGRLVGPLRPSNGFHGTVPTRRGFGSRCDKDLERFGKFEPRQVGAEAVVHPAAERQDRRWLVAGDVEAGRIVVDGAVAVGRVRIDDDECACREGVFADRRRRR